MRALEQLRGLRVVADPGALDQARWSAVPGTSTDDRGSVVVVRTARDEAFAIGAGAVEISDPHAIVEPEAGFVGRWLTDAELAALVVPHLEWPLPTERPALAQGSVAGVPARIWLAPRDRGGRGERRAGDPAASGDAAGRVSREAGTDRAALLVIAAAYAHELEKRLR